MENIYLIRIYNEREDFLKIGTSVHKFCRFYEIMKHGYAIDIVYMVIGLDFYVALNAEKYLQTIFKRHTPLVKFGGYTECFEKFPLIRYKNELDNIGINHGEIIENLPISWR